MGVIVWMKEKSGLFSYRLELKYLLIGISKLGPLFLSLQKKRNFINHLAITGQALTSDRTTTDVFVLYRFL